MQRRLSILLGSLLLLLCTVGAAGVTVVLSFKPLLEGRQFSIFLGLQSVNDALVMLSLLCSSAVVLTVMISMMVRRGILKRLRQFRVVAGGAPTSIPEHIGDELDPVAQQINELSLAVSQLRAQQRSEDEVLAAKRFTDNIIRSMFDVLIVMDADLKIVTVNDAACALLEYTELELVGKPITDIFQEQGMGIGPSVPEQLRSNAMRDNEMTYRAASGKLVQALVSASTMPRQRRPAAGNHHGG